MPQADLAKGVTLLGSVPRSHQEILSAEALDFVARLHRSFQPRREELLAARARRWSRLLAGERPDFLAETRDVREDSWRIAPVPDDLQDRRVEITGPVDRKMMINAFNSGASVFMADFEDALSPTWTNVVAGQANLRDAVQGRLEYVAPDGTSYRVHPHPATLLVRPRGWHLVEKHLLVDGRPVSASLFDVGLFLFHNATDLRQRGTGPYLYLPKLESHLEARLWNEAFLWTESELRLPVGTVKATVLIETILAALEMDEILHELRDHAAGLNAGRWDYIFSLIKKFHTRPEFVLPDRTQVTMTVPFMRAYTELLVRTCHRRGAHAMGGMAAFVPSRKDAEATERALAKVREDKLREAGDGFDGTWVAHPDLVPVAREVFDRALGGQPNQLHCGREEVRVAARDLLNVHVPGGAVTDAGVRSNVNVSLHYMEAWLRGQGAVALHHLMEDAATAEIARSQLWQWIRHGVRLADGRPVTRDFVQRVAQEEVEAARAALGADAFAQSRFADAHKLLERVALGADFAEFLTLAAYERLE